MDFEELIKQVRARTGSMEVQVAELREDLLNQIELAKNDAVIDALNSLTARMSRIEEYIRDSKADKTESAVDEVG